MKKFILGFLVACALWIWLLYGIDIPEYTVEHTCAKNWI